jgi:chromosome partitioning protein
VWASKSLVDLVKQRQEITEGKPKAAFVISRQITQTNIGKEVREVLEEYGLPVLKHGTFQRVLYPETAAIGQTVMNQCGKNPARQEIELLTREILEFCNAHA